jgi:hypothetical protein
LDLKNLKQVRLAVLKKASQSRPLMRLASSEAARGTTANRDVGGTDLLSCGAGELGTMLANNFFKKSQCSNFF